MSGATWRVAVLLVVGVAGGCVPAVRTPMATVPLAASVEEAGCTVVFLPGRWSRARAFERRDFGAVAAGAGVAARFVAADGHLGYYREQSLVERLAADLLEPARRRGDDIWLVGVSLGGLGAVITASERPDLVDGVVLMAPFLGEEELIAELRTDGFPPPGSTPAPDDLDDRLRHKWRWLADHADDPSRPILLAAGSADELAPGHDLLASLLPEGRSWRAPGGHDWSVWRTLWREIAASGIVCAGAAASG